MFSCAAHFAWTWHYQRIRIQTNATFRFVNHSSNCKLQESENLELYNFKVQMKFGDTEIMATAVDLSTGNAVSASVDFFTDKNPKYCTRL